MCPTDGRRDHQRPDRRRRQRRTDERRPQRFTDPRAMDGDDGESERRGAGRPRWGKGERSRGKSENGGEQALSRHFIGGRPSVASRRPVAGRRSAPRAIVCLNASMVDRLTAGLRGRWRPLSTGNSSLPAWACLSAHLLHISSG